MCAHTTVSWGHNPDWEGVLLAPPKKRAAHDLGPSWFVSQPAAVGEDGGGFAFCVVAFPL